MAARKRPDYRKGQIVTVFNQKASGEPVIEGRAYVVGTTGVEDQYFVRFLIGNTASPPIQVETETYERFVTREGQSDPTAYIAKARAEWLARKESAA